MSRHAARSPDQCARTRFRTTLALSVVFTVALLVRLVCLLDAADNPSFLDPIVDAGAYDMMARHMADAGEALPRLFWQPFLYPVFLAGIYRVFEGSIIAAKVIQALIGAVTCCLTFVLASKLFDRRAAIIAAVVTAFNGPLILFEGELVAAGLAALWAVLLVILFRSAAEHPTSVCFLTLGCVAALAVLTRPTFLPFVVVAHLWLAWSVWRRKGPRRSTVGTLIAAAAFATLVLPVAGWNLSVTGEVSFIPSAGGLNAYIGNNPRACDTLSIRPGAEWGDLITMPDRHGATTAAERNRFFYARVKQYATDQPFAFFKGLGRKTLQMIGSREIARNIDVYLARRWSACLAVLCWKLGPVGFPFGLILPLATVGVVFRWRRLGAPLLLFLSLYAASVILVFVTARYRVPMIPLTAVAAAAGLVAIIDMAQRRDLPRLLSAAGLLTVMLLAATQPGPFCEEENLLEADFYSCLGHAQHERGKVEKAIESYLTALDIDPELEQVHYNLGRIHSRRGELESSVAHYREAIRIDPEFAMAHNNLGSALHRSGRISAAIEHFREAARRDPELAVAQRNLASALLENAQPSEALAVLDRLHRMDPGNPEDHFMYGSARLQLGEAEAAVTALRQAITQGLDAARTRIELGTALLALQRTREALEQFESAILLDPDAARAHNNAGVALVMMGRMADAVPRFAEAVRRSPDHLDARFNLARALVQTGHPDRAVEELRAILDKDPGHSGARGLLERLSQR